MNSLGTPHRGDQGLQIAFPEPGRAESPGLELTLTAANLGMVKWVCGVEIPVEGVEHQVRPGASSIVVKWEARVFLDPEVFKNLQSIGASPTYASMCIARRPMLM